MGNIGLGGLGALVEGLEGLGVRRPRVQGPRVCHML